MNDDVKILYKLLKFSKKFSTYLLYMYFNQIYFKWFVYLIYSECEGQTIQQ